MDTAPNSLFPPLDPQLFEKQVPRYTSYPTAVQFHNGIGAKEYAAALKAVPEHQAVSLYFHVPFCHSLCHYCGCFTRVVGKVAPLEEYVKSLLAEMQLVAEMAGRRLPVAHLHFGGGSPNFLPDDLMQEILSEARRHFHLMPSCEIATELDPRLLTQERVQSLADQGFTRVSLGVQDFHGDVQKAVNRVQDFAHIENCVKWLRNAGIAAINFDFMYGLPLQTVESVRANIRMACALKPSRMAIFGYAHVPWMRPHQKLLEEHPLPDSATRFAMYEAARAEAKQHGYDMVGLDHFCASDDSLLHALQHRKLHRNFQGYTTDQQPVLLGFGLSSISHFPDVFVQNTTDPTLYRHALAEKKLPAARGVALSAEDHLRARIIEQIMCYLHVDLRYVREEWQTMLPNMPEILAQIDALVPLGIVKRQGSLIKVPERARGLTRLVCAAFDAYLDAPQGRHAKAV